MNIIKLALTIILLNLFYFINKFECQKTDKLVRICYERVEGEKNELLCNDPDFKYINVLKASADFVKIGSPMPVCEVKADLEKDIKSTMNFCNGRSTCVITDKFLDDNKLFSFQNYVYTLDTEKYYPLVLKLTINYNCINDSNFVAITTTPPEISTTIITTTPTDGSENTTRKHAPISEGVMIFLIVLGVLLFLIIVAILLIICVRRSRKAIYENEFNGGEENGTYSKQKTTKSSTEAIERNSDKFLLTDSPNNKKNQTTFETSGTYTSKQNTLYLNKAYIEENDLYSLPKKDEVEIKIDYDEYWRTKI